MWNPIFNPGGEEVRVLPNLAIERTDVSSVRWFFTGSKYSLEYGRGRGRVPLILPISADVRGDVL